MRLLRRAAANLALVAAGMLFALVLAEVVLRLSPLGKTSFYTYDPHLGWKLRAGAQGWQRNEGRAFLRVNRWGYRGGDWTLEKPADVRVRVAVLGDSFTEAQQVAEDKTFSAVIQRKLGACPMLHSAGVNRQRVEVLNFGCDSYGTAQELISLEREVWRFSPDLVVLAVFTGNDIRNNSVVLEGDKCRPFYVYRGGKPVLGGPFEDSWWFHLGCMARFESRHFQVLNLLGDARSGLRAYLRARRAAGATPRAKPAGAALAEPGVNDLIYRAPATPVWQEAWRVTEDEIEAAHREAERHGAGFLVVTLANPSQDSPDAAAREAYQKWIGVSDLFYPDERIAQLGRRDGFEVLNLARTIQDYAQGHHVYLHGFPNTGAGQGHWNELGHELAGDLIAGKLCEMLGSGRGQP